METETETSATFECRGIDILEPSDLTTLWSEEIAPELNESDDPTTNSQLIEEFLKALAVVEQEQDFLGSVDEWKSRLSEVSGSNKSTINDYYDHVSSQIRSERSEQGDDKKAPIDKFLKNRVEELYVIKSTDSNVDAKYQWHFASGDVVETQREWKQPHIMKDVLFDELGVNLSDPKTSNYDEWVKDWMLEIREKEVTRGTRTVAADDLRSQVESSAGYTDRQRAAREEQCYVEDADEYEEVEIPNQIVKRICEEHNLASTATLHAEMKAMGALARSSKRTRRPDGSWSTWWVLNDDWAAPAEVIEHEDEIDDASDDPLVGGEA